MKKQENKTMEQAAENTLKRMKAYQKQYGKLVSARRAAGRKSARRG